MSIRCCGVMTVFSILMFVSTGDPAIAQTVKRDTPHGVIAAMAQMGRDPVVTRTERAQIAVTPTAMGVTLRVDVRRARERQEAVLRVQLPGKTDLHKEFHFAVAPESGMFIPRPHDRSHDVRIRYWGTSDGQTLLRHTVANLSGVAEFDDLDLPLGVEALSAATVPRDDRFDHLIAVECLDRAVFMFFDADGLLGIRYAANDVIVDVDAYVTTTIETLQVYELPVVEGAEATCSISCGGSGGCSCTGDTCTKTDRTASCSDSGGGGVICTCRGTDCSCVQAM